MRYMRRKMINNILSKFNLELQRKYPRSMIQFVKSNLGNNLSGVEIGVEKGINAKSILKTLDMEILYLIDPYLDYSESEEYRADGEINRTQAIRRLIKEWDKIWWKFEKSEDCVNKIPNNLDFVYIDGLHDYESVKRDIKNYWPKIKKGGVLGGHDFDNGRYPVHDGVVKAVTEFAIKNKLKLYIGKGSDWWVIKWKQKQEV